MTVRRALCSSEQRYANGRFVIRLRNLHFEKLDATIPFNDDTFSWDAERLKVAKLEASSV